MFKANKALLALGETNRQRIIRLLAKRSMSVQEVADAFSISRPAISKHLKILSDAELIECHSEGTRNIYRLKQKGFDAIRSDLDSLWSHALARFKLLAENSSQE